MKKFMMSLSLVLVSSSVFAQMPVPGALTLHTIQCQSLVEHFIGVDVQLQCFTQALGPDHDLRGCNLITTELYQGAQSETETLKLVRQDLNSATLTGAQAIKVKLDKIKMSAEIYRGRSLEYSCN